MQAIQTTNPFPALDGAEYMLLTTYRRSGTPVALPVLFAQDGARVYLATRSDAGKVARLRATGRATIAPCPANGRLLGPKYAVQGRVLDAADTAQAEAALRAKYPGRVLSPNQYVILELAPCGVPLAALDAAA